MALGQYHYEMEPKQPQESESRHADKYIVRFPDGMRDQLKNAAKANNRTLNAEIVARLQQTFDGSSDAPEIAHLGLELARAKRDLSRSAFISERWLLELVMLWDLYLDLLGVADAMGIKDALPKKDLELAAFIGETADDDFKRHSEEFDPMALYDVMEATESELQAALEGVVKLVSDHSPPTADDAIAAKALRERILNRKRREYLPIDTTPEAEAKRAAVKKRLPKSPK